LAYFAVKNPGIFDNRDPREVYEQSCCAETKNCGMKILDKMSDSDGVQFKERKSNLVPAAEARGSN